jgi:hypothetical protein
VRPNIAGDVTNDKAEDLSFGPLSGGGSSLALVKVVGNAGRNHRDMDNAIPTAKVDEPAGCVSSLGTTVLRV